MKALFYNFLLPLSKLVFQIYEFLKRHMLNLNMWSHYCLVFNLCYDAIAKKAVDICFKELAEVKCNRREALPLYSMKHC